MWMAWCSRDIRCVFRKSFSYFEFYGYQKKAYPGAKAPDDYQYKRAKAKALAYLEATRLYPLNII
jgi:hypothetical protein